MNSSAVSLGAGHHLATVLLPNKLWLMIISQSIIVDRFAFLNFWHYWCDFNCYTRIVRADPRCKKSFDCAVSSAFQDAELDLFGFSFAISSVFGARLGDLLKSFRNLFEIFCFKSKFGDLKINAFDLVSFTGKFPVSPAKFGFRLMMVRFSNLFDTIVPHKYDSSQERPSTMLIAEIIWQLITSYWQDQSSLRALPSQCPVNV